MIGSAVVAGGGIAGLVAAIALRRAGWTVTVLERSGFSSPTGAGLSLAPNALRGLDAIGIGNRIRSLGVPTAAASAIRDPSGKYLVRTDQSPEALPLRAYERSVLHRELLAALPPECIRLDCRVDRVLESATGVHVHFEGGQMDADLLVGADGIHSVIRRQFWPDAREVFLNYGVWVGLAELADGVGPGGASGFEGSMTLGKGRYFLIHPVGPNRVYWATGERAERVDAGGPDLKSEVLSRVGAWHDPIPSLVAATRAEEVKRLNIHEVAPLPSFVMGPIVLVGDAAHAMSPDRGQGAGQAIEDGVTLASTLSTAHTIRDALRDYDKARRPRSQMVARDARRLGQNVINAGRVRYGLLKAMLHMMPASLWASATRPDSNPIWAWQPPMGPVREP